MLTKDTLLSVLDSSNADSDTHKEVLEMYVRYTNVVRAVDGWEISRNRSAEYMSIISGILKTDVGV